MPAETSIIVGNLDGVHCGHRALIDAARAASGPAGRVVVLAFDPHPLAILRRADVPGRLTGFDRRVDLLREAGADEVVRLEPTVDLLALSAEAFIARIHADHCPAFIVEGPDFRFGRGRAGSIETLRRHEADHGYRTVIIDAVEVTLQDRSIVRVGSSLIRWLLIRGRADDAAIALGRPYELLGEVVQGDRRGRELGFPTANLAPPECLLPADGIYAGDADLPDGRTVAAAISVGTKPTFGESPRTCEAHLIDYDGPLDVYGWRIHLRFRHWMRDQISFRSVDGLVDQLRLDVQRCEEMVSGALRTSLAGS